MAREWRPWSDEELDRQIEEARLHSKLADPSQPRVESVRYDRESGRIEIELKDGCMFAFPAELAQGLGDAAPDQLEQVEIVGDGYALHWGELDADLTVAGLLAGHLGSRVWMREHARRAGSVTSEAKARAARRNGLKGGRPPGSGKGRKSG